APLTRKRQREKTAVAASIQARVSSFLGSRAPRKSFSACHLPSFSSVLRAASMSAAQEFQASRPWRNSSTVWSRSMPRPHHELAIEIIIGSQLIARLTLARQRNLEGLLEA